ncbi:hypothetical protein LPJ56_004040, partial [Coemansia sp. RSA 2599]
SAHSSRSEPPRHAAPRSEPSPAVSADALDLRQLARSGENVALLSIKALKALLVKNHVDTSNIVEKQDLVQRVERLVANAKLEMEMEQDQDQDQGPASVAASAGSGADENLCKICWDAATNVVFTPCGHLCTCLECAGLIMKRERRECPICREFIRDYIRVFRA